MFYALLLSDKFTDLKVNEKKDIVSSERKPFS